MNTIDTIAVKAIKDSLALLNDLERADDQILQIQVTVRSKSGSVNKYDIPSAIFAPIKSDILARLQDYIKQLKKLIL